MENGEILSIVLENITKVSFRDLAELKGEDSKLFDKHYLIHTVEQVLKIANEKGYSLAIYQGCIYAYNGACWNLLEDDDLKSFLGQSALQMGVNKHDAKFYKFRDSLLRQFYCLGKLSRKVIESDTVLINLKNGTYEISPKEKQLRAFKSEDFMTYQLQFNYDSTAAAPQFQTYLDRVLPEKELQKILAEYIGYVFIRHLKLEKVLLLFGSGANGKSVFFEIVNALLGEQNVSNFSLYSLNEPSYRAKLANKLLNYGSEIKGSLESDTFKQLASGEPIEAKMLYKDPFTMRDYAKLLFNCNELPKDVEHNEAYFRRFLIVPFEVTIPFEERDSELPKKIIKTELSGVFNWVLLGLERVLEQKKFTQNDKVNKYLDRYKMESDSVAMFLEDEGYRKSASEFIILSNLYYEYKNYCTSSGFNALNLKNFKARLESQKITIQRRANGHGVYVSK
jgi:putative DNA primase/helicase